MVGGRLAASVALLVTLPALAGCVMGADDEGEGPTGAPLTGPPPGCDGGPRGIAHADGRALTGHEDAVPVACLVRTGFTSEGEPTIGFTANALWMSTAFEDGDGTPYEYGVPRSTDEGASWDLERPTIGGASAHRFQLDPYLHVDPVTHRVFVDNLLTVNCSLLSWTDDEGATWEHSLAGCMETDHQTVFTGPPTLSTTRGYPNVVYRCAINTVALSEASWSDTCQRSLDGGVSWLPPGAPAYHADPAQDGGKRTPGNCPGGVGHGVTDTEGRVYLPKAWCGRPWLAMSDDEGLTWERVLVADVRVQADEENDYGHDGAVAVDTAGNVYYAWVGEDWRPYLAVSTDRGHSWSAPVPLAPPGLTDAALIAVTAGGPGRVAWSFMGTTNGPGGRPQCGDALDCLDGEENTDYSNVTWRGYIGLTTHALDAAPVLFTAPTSEDPLVVGECGPIRCAQVVDFIDVVIGPDGTPWAPFVDGCPDPCTGPVDAANGEGVVGRLWGGPSLWAT